MFFRKVFSVTVTNMTKALYKTLLTLLLAAAPVMAQAETEILDRVAAIVEDNIILESELENRLAQIRANLRQSGQEVPEDRLRREVLDHMILESIQLQMAERVGLRINDEQLNDAMTRVAAQNGMSLPEFQQALNASGTSYAAAREQIRREMLLQQVQRGNVNQRIQITDQEIENFLESEEGRVRTAPEYRFAHVLIPVPGDADAATRRAAESRANAIAEKLRTGADYRSLDGEGIKANDLGWRKQGDVPSLFADLAKKMHDGEVADPVQSASGYHVVKLLESRGHQEVISQTKARHILLKPSAIRSEEQTEQLAARLRQRALDGTSFRELARTYSEDIGSAQEGGDLGWTSPGQLVPAFQQAMDDTPVGGISQPFKSRYGWHIVKVEDRRQQDVTEELRQRMARNIIHDRKFEEELDIWLRKIRDEAYVDIKL